jgi:chromosome segregation ATPase
LPFQLELLNKKVHFADFDTTTTVYAFFDEVYTPSVFSYAMEYTIGLPGKIIGLLVKGEDEIKQPLPKGFAADSVVSVTKDQMEVIENMRERVTVSLSEETGVLNLTVEMPDPNAAAQVGKTSISLLKEYMTNYRTRKAQEDLEHARQQLEEVRTALQEADAAAPTADGDAGAEADRAARARAALQEAEATLASARTRLEHAQAQHARDAAEARAWDRAAQRQRAAFEARQGYAQGPRHTLTSGVAGVEGSLADLIRVPEELQDAIALALGRRAEYVLTRDDASAREVLAHVRQRGGWVTLLPLTLVRRSRPTLDAAFAAEAGVIGLALLVGVMFNAKDRGRVQ